MQFEDSRLDFFAFLRREFGWPKPQRYGKPVSGWHLCRCFLVVQQRPQQTDSPSLEWSGSTHCPLNFVPKPCAEEKCSASDSLLHKAIRPHRLEQFVLRNEP